MVAEEQARPQLEVDELVRLEVAVVPTQKIIHRTKPNRPTHVEQKKWYD